jgi:hypothetical protein
MNKIIPSLMIFLVLLISCKSEPEGSFDSSNLPGMIYDNDNRPCDKVVLTVWFMMEDMEGEKW